MAGGGVCGKERRGAGCGRIRCIRVFCLKVVVREWCGGHVRRMCVVDYACATGGGGEGDEGGLGGWGMWKVEQQGGDVPAVRRSKARIRISSVCVFKEGVEKEGQRVKRGQGGGGRCSDRAVEGKAKKSSEKGKEGGWLQGRRSGQRRRGGGFEGAAALRRRRPFSASPTPSPRAVPCRPLRAAPHTGRQQQGGAGCRSRFDEGGC